MALIAGDLCCVAVEVSWMWGRARGWDDVDAAWKIVGHAGRVALREGCPCSDFGVIRLCARGNEFVRVDFWGCP